MSSKILYDTRNNEIKKCQVKPRGSVGMPSFDAVCRSARITENEKEYMETIIINESMSTKEAIRTLRINNDKIILKPLVELSTDKTEVDISANEIFTLTVNITDTLENETFTNVDISIEDATVNIDLTDNQGTADIKLSDIDKYEIKCNDDNFRTQTLVVEGV